MSNIISMFDAKKKKEEKKEEAVKEPTEASFEEIMKANKAKEEKLAKERAGLNKGVLRSYRIKD